MSQSLAPECTQLKHAYDTCFNNWFAGYLQPSSKDEDESGEPQVDTQQQVKEYQEKCGQVWLEYKDCLQVRPHRCLLPYLFGLSSEQKAVKQKGLDEVLDRAREETPLKDIRSADED
jgi:TRIAP1/MDM35 family protein